MGIDLSLNGTGLAILDEDLEIVEKQLIKLNGNKDTPQLKGMERAIYIMNCIEQLLKKHQPSVVVIEGYSFGSKGRSVFDLGEIGGIVRYELKKLGVKYFEVPPPTLKKYITGNGRADKIEMQAAVLNRYGVNLSDDNENDAFCLAAMFLEMDEADFLKQIGERIKTKKEKLSKKKTAA